VIRARGNDSVSRRAVTSSRRKAALAARAAAAAGATLLLPQSSRLHAPPLPETAFLVAAAARPVARSAHADHLTSIFAELRRRDAERPWHVAGAGLGRGRGPVAVLHLPEREGGRHCQRRDGGKGDDDGGDTQQVGHQREAAPGKEHGADQGV
jgi:hypothetical protein